MSIQKCLFVGGPLNDKVLELKPERFNEWIWADNSVNSYVKDVRYIRRQWCYIDGTRKVIIYVYLQWGMSEAKAAQQVREYVKRLNHGKHK